MPNTRIYFWILTIFVIIIMAYNPILGIISGMVLITLILYNWQIEHNRKKLWTEYIENITQEIDETSRNALINLPMALTIIEIDGSIIWYNSRFNEITGGVELLEKNIEDIITNLKIKDIISNDTEEGHTLIHFQDKIFKITYNIVKNIVDTKYSIILYWSDITNYQNLKTLYNDEKPNIAYINIDNYDEIIQETPLEKRALLIAEIDNTIRVWAKGINAFITKYDDDKYSMYFENKYLEKQEAKKFSVLDDIRKIETYSDFPCTISLGIGVGGKNPLQQSEFARAAMDLALGRGGDQVVIKKINKIEYYGGRSQVVEKRNKGKSRIMAHAMRQLIDQSTHVVIMGHKTPDMDCFGASLGVYRMVLNRKKSASIVLDDMTEGIDALYKTIKNNNTYQFIDNDMAIQIVNKDTLVVVVDTYRPSFTQCPEILTKTDKIVVIDHHRKMEEFIDNAVLSYMEPYASSSCELVTEMLQYFVDKKEIEKVEADALLAGIAIDTKVFSNKTGVRTFEAASWLRRIGADGNNIKQLFQTDMNSFIAKAEIMKNAKAITPFIALSTTDLKRSNANILVSQAADELLDIKGITATFVISTNAKNDTLISARSTGDINVQVIMEKIGGGGHLTMAGMQTKESPQAVEEKLKHYILEYVKEGVVK